MKAVAWMAAGALLAAAGCSSLGEIITGGPKEQSRVREDAVQLACGTGKTLLLRIEPGGKSAWIILPEREFRLDLMQGVGDTRYSNGKTTLLVKDEAYSVEEGGTASFANCRKPGA
jgi:hypothetical protein